MPHFIHIENDDNENIIGCVDDYINSSSSNVPDILDHMNSYHYTAPSTSSLLSPPPSLLPTYTSTQALQETSLILSSASSSNTTTASSSLPLPTQQQNGSTIAKTREELMSDIENSIEQIITSIALGEDVKLPFTSRPTSISRASSSSNKTGGTSSTQTQENQRKRGRPAKANSSSQAIVATQQQREQQNDEMHSEENDSNSNERTRALTLSCGKYARSLARYLSVLQMIYEALAYKFIVTKRDMYYRDVGLFRTQSVVDTIVNDISCHYNVPRSSLNVSAASKGLVFGPVIIRLKNNKILDCMSRQMNTDEANDEQGTLIPPISQASEVHCRAKCMLVIEKEATFRYLVSVGFCQMFPQSCILVTGKGYPDLSTRQFVKYFSTHFKNMPIFALMDNDPHGLDIYATYKWGARALAFDVLNLAVNEMELIGLTCQDRTHFNISAECRIPMTERDRSKLLSMIRTGDLDETPGASQLRDRGWRDNNHEQLLASQGHHAYINEINLLLKSDYKCELQALNHSGPYGLTSYLTSKLAQYQL